MLPEPEKPKQDETIPSQVTFEPAGEFAEPNIPPDISHVMKPVPAIPTVPTGVSGVEPAKEAIPPLTTPPSRGMTVKGNVDLRSTWRAVLEEKHRLQGLRKAA